MEGVENAFATESGIFNDTVGHGVETEGRGVADDKSAHFGILGEFFGSVDVLGEESGMDAELT